jgi:hypothetical protein
MGAVLTRFSPEDAVRVLREAAELNLQDPNREGTLLRFPSAGQVVMTGDMHGHVRNFEKLQRFCTLATSPARSVVLHELIHSEPSPAGNPDYSIDLLLRACEWKTQFPDNVFFLQSNHELAQLRGQEITKGGRSVLFDFARGIGERFGAAHTGKILEAVNAYIASLPLAARLANRIFLSHSLPDALMVEWFDPAMFNRMPTAADLSPGGAAYSLVWGRFHTAEVVAAYCRKFDCDICVVGHTPQESGYHIVGQMVILASDHNHGTFLPIDLSRQYTTDSLEASIRKFVSVE